MKRLALGFLLSVLPLAVTAQGTNTDSSGTPAGANNGPVVMPPSGTGPDQSTLPNAAMPMAGAPNAAGTNSQVPPNGEEIYDIRPPFFYLHSWTWLWIVLATIAAVALIYWLWRWLAGRTKLSAKDAYTLALEKLEQARTLMDPSNPEPYGVAVSETIRTYLGQRFGSPSSRRTTEEFLRQMEADPDTPLAAHRDLLREFLQACDLFKFAKYQPGPEELEQVHERAVSFVKATKPLDEEQKGAAAEPPATAAAAAKPA